MANTNWSGYYNQQQPYYYQQNQMGLNNQQVNTAISTIPSPPPQQVQQTPQKTYIQGRLVTSEDDIVANEVPMDGNYGIFVQSDLRTIYAKTWGKDGLIDTKTYQLVDDQQQPQVDPIAIILERLDRIEKKLGEAPRQQTYPKGYNKNYHKSNSKKGVTQNDESK